MLEDRGDLCCEAGCGTAVRPSGHRSRAFQRPQMLCFNRFLAFHIPLHLPTELPVSAPPRSFPHQLINPSETFGDIVIDYNYVECSSACITALLAFAAQHRDHRTNEIEMSVHRGVQFIKRYARASAVPLVWGSGPAQGLLLADFACAGAAGTLPQHSAPGAAPDASTHCRLGLHTHPPFPPPHSIQRADGSWYGNWAVSFTYGTWFGVVALAATGEDVHGSDSLRRACAFLISKQRRDGGWGESYLSSQTKVCACVCVERGGSWVRRRSGSTFLGRACMADH